MLPNVIRRARGVLTILAIGVGLAVSSAGTAQASISTCYHWSYDGPSQVGPGVQGYCTGGSYYVYISCQNPNGSTQSANGAIRANRAISTAACSNSAARMLYMGIKHV